MNLRRLVPVVTVAFLAASPMLARQNILKNGSMESGQGPGAIDPMVPDQWTMFGTNVERSPTVNLVPPGAGHALKSFGDATSNAAGASQEVTGITAGQAIFASVQLYSPANDKLGGSGQAGLVVEFLNLFGGTISLQQVYPLTAESTGSTPVLATIGPIAAPAGTTKVRVSCRLTWTPGAVNGAAYWDDAQLTVNGGANLLLNGDFETAGPSPGQSAVGIDDWTGFNDQEKSADAARDGLASLKLGMREAYSGLYQNMKSLVAGEHLLMKGYAWNPSSDPLPVSSPTTAVGLKLEFSSNSTVPPPEENLAFDPNATVNSWTPVTLSTTVPAEATAARVVIIFVGAADNTGVVYFDMASAQLGSMPGVEQLYNTSFEDGPGGVNGIDYWTEFGSSTRLACFEPAADGLCSAKANSADVTGLHQQIPVTAGDTIMISCLLLTPTGQPITGGVRAGVKVEWVMGAVPPPVDINTPGQNNTIHADAPQDTWLPLTIDYTMPAGSNAITRFVALMQKGSALTGRTYVDSCEAVVTNRFDGIDGNGDDAEDLADFAWMQTVYAGNAVATAWGSLTFDYNDDTLVNMTDFTYFAPRMTGPAD